jgi:hypothetical protein
LANSWQLIDWPATWAGVTAALTLGLLVVTGIYAWLTFRMVRASESQIRELGRPRIIVHVSPRESSFLTICIENTGLSTAEKIDIRLNQPVYQYMGYTGQNLQEYPAFSETLPSLPPRGLLRFALGTQYLTADLDRDKHPYYFVATASYEFSGQKITENFEINVKNQYSGVLIEQDHLADFSKNFPGKFDKFVEKIVEAIQNTESRNKK